MGDGAISNGKSTPSRGKLIVRIKIGKSAAGAKMVTSHTATLTGADAGHDAMFQQHGVIRLGMESC